MSFTRRRLLAALPAVALAACAGDPATAPAFPADDRVFQAWYRNLQDQMQADPYYKPIGVRGTVPTQEFSAKLHDAYRKKVTPDALVEWIIARYPGQRYEAEFIAHRLPR